MFKEVYTKENLYIGEHKNCHNSFNIKWILAQLGRHMRLTKANDSPKFQTDTLKDKKVMATYLWNFALVWPSRATLILL